MLTERKKRKLAALSNIPPRYVFTFYGGPSGSWRTTARIWERMESDGFHTLYEPRWISYMHFTTVRDGGAVEEYLSSTTRRTMFARAVSAMKHREELLDGNVMKGRGRRAKDDSHAHAARAPRRPRDGEREGALRR